MDFVTFFHITNLLIMNLSAGILGIVLIWLWYRKERAHRPEARKNFEKRIVILTLAIAAINLIQPVIHLMQSIIDRFPTGPSPAATEMAQRLYTTFTYIPPGKFIMGSPEGEQGRVPDETQHTVTLTQGFYMQTTEVTQGQWRAVMGENPSHFAACGDDCPVENISWNDAQKFIKRLNELTREGPYRLPTEAEWEYACRAGTRTRYSSGDSEQDLDRAGWYRGNAEATTHPVARKEPNAFGLYDMHGNVSEWCQDRYGEYPKEAVMNPAGPGSDRGRILRGGSWRFRGWRLRSACRLPFKPEARSGTIGLRLARSQSGR